MQLHDLKSKNKKKKKRIGRGGARGTFSGRGVKGQKARAGSGGEPIIRGLIKKYPKLKGYNTPSGQKPAVINLKDLEKYFSKGDEVNPTTLLEKKLIRRVKGKAPSVKILGSGKITKSLKVTDCKASETAIKKIKKAGGKI